MQMKSGVAFQPRVDAGMFVRAIVVDDQVQVQIEWRLDVDELEKPNKFLMPVARHAVAAELERFDQMRLPVVLLPNTMNRVFAEALRLGQAARAPMGCVGRGGVQGRMNDRAHLAMGDSWNAAGTRGVFFQSRKPQGQKALPPELHGGSRNPQSAGNHPAQNAIGGHPDNLCALDHPERKASSRRPSVENDSFVGGQRYGFGHPHEYRA